MLLKKVLATTAYVTKNSRSVKINEKAVSELARKIARKPAPIWANAFHFQDEPEKICQYVFLLDSLNFCFWAEKSKARWTIKNGSKNINGYFALASALKKAVKKYPILNADYLSKISRQDLADIFAPANGQIIPLFEKRLSIARQTGGILAGKYNGQALNVVKTAKRSADKLVDLIVNDFPSFRDVTSFNGKKIYILKRAQILAGDIWGALDGKGLGAFRDIGKLTCFADYKIPQILHYFGAIEYSPKLLKKIKAETLIKAGSREEIEIRAGTIWAVEKIKQALPRQSRKVPAFQIDWILWNMSQKVKMPIPYHKTKTIYY